MNLDKEDIEFDRAKTPLELSAANGSASGKLLKALRLYPNKSTRFTNDMYLRLYLKLLQERFKEILRPY